MELHTAYTVVLTEELEPLIWNVTTMLPENKENIPQWIPLVIPTWAVNIHVDLLKNKKKYFQYTDFRVFHPLPPKKLFQITMTFSYLKVMVCLLIKSTAI